MGNCRSVNNDIDMITKSIDFIKGLGDDILILTSIMELYFNMSKYSKESQKLILQTLDDIKKNRIDIINAKINQRQEIGE